LPEVSGNDKAFTKAQGKQNTSDHDKNKVLIAKADLPYFRIKARMYDDKPQKTIERLCRYDSMQERY